jgi:hypothetical protein
LQLAVSGWYWARLSSLDPYTFVAFVIFCKNICLRVRWLIRD